MSSDESYNALLIDDYYVVGDPKPTVFMDLTLGLAGHRQIRPPGVYISYELVRPLRKTQLIIISS